MKLRVLHTTRYDYLGPVNMAQHMAHLSPISTPGQRLLEHQLRITPEPAARSATTDVFGNLRTFFSLQAPHESLTIEADSLIQTLAPPAWPDPFGPQQPDWASVRQHFQYRAQAPYEAASEFLFASPHVPRDERFAAFARPDFGVGVPLLDAARALMERIHTGLTYDAASTEVSTPALDALAQGKGVCQDFAHIMIGCLRSLGLPARYVSGYLLTRPSAGKPRLIGADASHAWIAVYLPHLPDANNPQAPSVGGVWVDFDPTNNRCGWGSPGEDYVTLAVGRDFSDVSPMRGVIQSGAGHELTVEVTVAPPEEMADLLAASET